MLLKRCTVSETALGPSSRPDGHYLNLPVVEEDGRLVGIVDVLKLTYATLEQASLSRGALGWLTLD